MRIQKSGGRKFTCCDTVDSQPSLWAQTSTPMCGIMAVWLWKDQALKCLLCLFLTLYVVLSPLLTNNQPTGAVQAWRLNTDWTKLCNLQVRLNWGCTKKKKIHSPGLVEVTEHLWQGMREVTNMKSDLRSPPGEMQAEQEGAMESEWVRQREEKTWGRENRDRGE